MSGKKIWATLDPFLAGGKIMGRGVANTGFLLALLNADAFDEHHFFPGDVKTANTLAEHLAKLFPGLHARGAIKVMPRVGLPRALAQTRYHCFHLSDCVNYPAYLARLRNAHSREIFPITSVTHSLSYTRYARDFLAHLWPGTTARDCVVCTSSTAKSVVEGYYGFLREGLGLDRGAFKAPGTTVIPLGVDRAGYGPGPVEQREKLRRDLDIAPGQAAVLILGRISYLSKMDLLPVLRAFQRLSAQGLDREKFCVITAGWEEDSYDSYRGRLADLAGNLGLDFRLVLNPSEQAKVNLYKACDIFLSVSDNLQETFGLTVVEAAMSGLAAVVSDFDGYRDLVEHGVTGFRIPTIGPGPTPGLDDLAPALFDNHHHLLMAQQTAVDVKSLAESLGTLIENPGLCREMGQNARRRAEESYAWPRVIEQYLDLWDRLWDAPVDPDMLGTTAHPLSVPYDRVFGHYASRTLDSGDRLVWSRTGEAVYRGGEFYLVYLGLEEIIDPERVRKLLYLARQPIEAGRLIEKLSEPGEPGRENARFHVMWAVKHDLLESADPSDT